MTDNKKNWKLRHRMLRNRKAFSLTELLVVMLIIAILGGAVVSSLLVMFNMFEQLNDYIAGRQEMEFVAQTIGQELSNIGLGMPNNRQERGTFATSFARESANPQPIMAKMGKWHEKWGGPVTLGAKNVPFDYDNIQLIQSLNIDLDGDSNGDAYGGPELFYAWGAPTGIKAVVKGGTGDGGAPIPSADVPLYRNGRYNEQHRGAVLHLGSVTTGRHPESRAVMTLEDVADDEKWILFPTARLPMLVNRFNSLTDLLEVQLAPHAGADLKASIVGMDEIYLPRVSRIFLRPDDESDLVHPNRGQVVQQLFGPPDYNDVVRENVLAHNIDGLYFTYEPVLRILSVYIASRGGGITRNPGSIASSWLSNGTYPGAGVITDDRGLLVNRVDWRIRN